MTDSIRFLDFNAALPGDFNGDGAVDSGDYDLWRDAFGESAVAPDDPEAAADFLVWQRGLGAEPGGKPDGVVIIIIGARGDITDGTSNTLLPMQGADDGQWRIGGFSDVSGLGLEIAVADVVDGADLAMWEQVAAIWDDADIVPFDGARFDDKAGEELVYLLGQMTAETPEI
jgi:hypothetical protein